jgi:hypothetical protein
VPLSFELSPLTEDHRLVSAPAHHCLVIGLSLFSERCGGDAHFTGPGLNPQSALSYTDKPASTAA